MSDGKAEMIMEENKPGKKDKCKAFLKKAVILIVATFVGLCFAAGYITLAREINFLPGLGESTHRIIGIFGGLVVLACFRMGLTNDLFRIIEKDDKKTEETINGQYKNDR